MGTSLSAMLPLRTSSGFTAKRCVASPRSMASTNELKERLLKPLAPPAPKFLPVRCCFSLSWIFFHSAADMPLGTYADSFVRPGAVVAGGTRASAVATSVARSQCCAMASGGAVSALGLRLDCAPYRCGRARKLHVEL